MSSCGHFGALSFLNDVRTKPFALVGYDHVTSVDCRAHSMPELTWSGPAELFDCGLGRPSNRMPVTIQNPHSRSRVSPGLDIQVRVPYVSSWHRADDFGAAVRAVCCRGCCRPEGCDPC